MIPLMQRFSRLHLLASTSIPASGSDTNNILMTKNRLLTTKAYTPNCLEISCFVIKSSLSTSSSSLVFFSFSFWLLSKCKRSYYLFASACLMRYIKDSQEVPRASSFLMLKSHTSSIYQSKRSMRAALSISAKISLWSLKCLRVISSSCASDFSFRLESISVIFNSSRQFKSY